MRVAVVGVGGTGSAALRFLAKAGHTAVGFEQFAVGHTRGSSHGESRIIRYTYPDEFHTRMMGKAYPLWAELESEWGEELFVRCGGLLFGRPDSSMVEETVATLEKTGLSCDILTREAATERFPAVKLQEGEVALFQVESGFLRASDCVRANVQVARGAGAEVRENSTVLEVRQEGETALVTTNAGEEEFDRVVVTAGPWMEKLLGELGVQLLVEQRQVVYLEPERNTPHFEPERLPVWIDAEELTYGFPSDGSIAGIKLASHVLGRRFDPDEADRPIIPEDLAKVTEYGRRRFPDLGSTVAYAAACLYTMTPDENFIVDTVPGMPKVTLVSGCSGHGFKFTVLLGKLAADLATGHDVGWNLEPWRLGRFRNGN